MILPLGDAPNPRGVPLITYALLLTNIAVYVFITLPLSFTAPAPSDPALIEYVRVIARNVPPHVSVEQILRQITAYDLFVFRYGFRPAAPSLPDLFFSLFLHANFVHLFGNMLFLWIYGDNVEHRLGAIPYLGAYLGAGALATLFHTAFALGSPLPLIGASGAISGILGFYFRWFPHNRVRLFVLLFPFFMDVLVVPARLVLAMFLVVDNLLPFLLAGAREGSGVAYGAHIGGFFAGLAIAWLMDRRALAARPRAYHAVEAPEDVGTPQIEALRDALAAGRFADAARTYFSLYPERTRRILTPQDSLALADWLRRNGHDDAALLVYRRHLRDYPRGPGAAEAHLGAGLIQLEALNQLTPAYQHFLDALDADPTPEVASRARAGLDAITARQKLALKRRSWM